MEEAHEEVRGRAEAGGQAEDLSEEETRKTRAKEERWTIKVAVGTVGSMPTRIFREEEETERDGERELSLAAPIQRRARQREPMEEEEEEEVVEEEELMREMPNTTPEWMRVEVHPVVRPLRVRGIKRLLRV